MKIVIYGATGTIGRLLVKQALAIGHQVTACARNPSKLEIKHPNLILKVVDVFNLQNVTTSLIGADAVLISLGSSKLSGNVRSKGTDNIIYAMQQQGIKRLICQTTLGTGESYKNLNFVWKYLMFGLILRSVFKDHVIQEKSVCKSRLDWTIIRPSAFSNDSFNSPLKRDFSSNEKNLSLKINRAEVAKFMLEQLNSEEYLHQMPCISH